MPVDKFQDDVVKGEVITRAILEQRGKPLIWLRYPYLHSGATAETHQADTLIHCNELSSVSLRDSITRMRKRGYTFISRPDTFAGPGRTWLSRTATVTRRPLTPETASLRPVVPTWITELPN